MKKWLACLLALVLMVAMTSVAMAAATRTSGDFEYTVKGNGTATIVGYTGADGDLIIPNMVDGYTITTIGEEAFKDCGRFFSVTLPESITAIQDKAFWGSGVTSINIPNTVEYIGYGAFVDCSDEIKFRISNDHPRFATIGGALYNKSKKELLCRYGLAKIPEGITSIGDYAYWGVSLTLYGGKNFALPSTLKKIGDFSFAHAQHDRYADNDDELKIPASVEYIGISAFEGFDGKIEFARGSSITEISDRAFATEIEDDAAVTLSFPEPMNITKVGNQSFKGCRFKAHTQGNLFENIGIFGEGAFQDALILGSDPLPISETCRVIPQHAFALYVCNPSLIEIPAGVEVIESGAFSTLLDCEFQLPETLTDIAADAFAYDSTFIVEAGSYAERWAKENAYPYKVNGERQNLDWLNN